jgi:tRNA nucleotidyltransferase/poly(A) polymerase
VKVIPRAEHILSRRDIDPDALRVLTRLHESEYSAYLVGGSVRDLLLSRRPKDFDIGTDAHPYEIKKLFRNCWIIGRRFRLAHVKFGLKTIEVATFRKHVPAADAAAEAANAEAEAQNPDPEGSNEPVVVHSDEDRSPAPPASDEGQGPHVTGQSRRRRGHHDEHGIVRRDNVYGTPEEDAFRRDFTVNALFYDIATQSVIDYTGGLDDLHHKRIVSIGDPAVRFTEDPVRMLRAAVFAARLGFTMDDAVEAAIDSHGGLIQKASPARLLEEYFKILRSGHAEATFRELHRVGLLELMTPELEDPPQELWTALMRLDMYRRMHDTMPADLVNPILAGALLVPMGLVRAEEDQLNFGMLTLPRKDIDRLRHVLTTVPKLTDPNLPPRLLRGLPGRPSFHDAVTWLEIFGDAPEAVAHWKEVKARTPLPKAEPRRRGGRGGASRGGHGPHLKDPSHQPEPRPDAPNAAPGHVTDGPRKRRRRGRRRRGRGGPGGPPPTV